MFICSHCKQALVGLSTANKANHSRWCLENPKRKSYLEKLEIARAAIKLPRNQFVKAKEEGRVIVSLLKGRSGNKGKYKHSAETIEVIRNCALSSKHRRLVKSTRQYLTKDGNVVLLDSSWEEILAKRLDELNIRWVRPSVPIVWVDASNTKHHYFPDFFLPDYNIFLDPKNPHAMNVQKEKLSIITKMMPNLILLKTLQECSKFAI